MFTAWLCEMQRLLKEKETRSRNRRRLEDDVPCVYYLQLKVHVPAYKVVENLRSFDSAL